MKLANNTPSIERSHPINNRRYYNYEVQAMSRYEKKVLKEIGRGQVRHVPLEEYAVGSEHFERLWAQIAECKRFTWPSLLTLNV